MPLKFIPTPESSNIVGFCYNEKKQELYIEFKSEKGYVYTSVPKSIVDDLENAESTGSFHAKNIKNLFNYFQATPKLRKTWEKAWAINK